MLRGRQHLSVTEVQCPQRRAEPETGTADGSLQQRGATVRGWPYQGCLMLHELSSADSRSQNNIPSLFHHQQAHIKRHLNQLCFDLPTQLIANAEYVIWLLHRLASCKSECRSEAEWCGSLSLWTSRVYHESKVQLYKKYIFFFLNHYLSPLLTFIWILFSLLTYNIPQTWNKIFDGIKSLQLLLFILYDAWFERWS